MEILPFILLCAGGLVFYKYQTECLNLLVPKSFKAIKKSDELYIARKLSGLLKYQYCTQNGLDSDLVEVQIV
jgi:hypothetical protein